MKIPGTTSTPIRAWEDFQRYARHLADDPTMTSALALRLLELAGGVSGKDPANG